MDTFSFLDRAMYSLKDSLFPCLMAFKYYKSHLGFLLLANCSMNMSINWANKQIELLDRWVYHYKDGPMRLKPNPLHMHASHRSLGIAVVNMCCLYCAM